ncbi:hypothetical protein PVAP13_5NG005900 [Panicum virgatum]|uniref:Pectinesterase inhibitor domain-containing protein n=1 Tax=Panicum virgatum TaxID=38727 RepID=A0A8T0RLD2_PANVG|nr:hypothetical protein PVAP13_5NG005900 [Panicum virgatum]
MAHIKLGSPEPTRSQRGCAQSNRCRRLLILVSVVGVALAVGLAVSLTIFAVRRPRHAPGDRPSAGRGPTEAIARACGVTRYPALCASELTALPGAAAAGDADLVPMSLDATCRRVADALSNVTALAVGAPAAAACRDDCLELLDVAGELLERSVRAVAASPANSTDGAAAAHTNDDDVMSWLSAALTYYDTCHDSLQQVGSDEDGDRRRVKAQMLEYLTNLGEHLSNSLAIFKALGTTPKVDDDVRFPPRWVNHSDRRLLVAAAADMVPDMVVAKDGSGMHLSISDAVEAAPEYSSRRVVIYVTAGVYTENVMIGRAKTNLMLVGAGAGETEVVGWRSVQDGFKTFHTATVSVLGDGFMMRNMTMENSAGPAKQQAVALLMSGDHAVAYRCAVLGYQDTLYAHAQRHFYRECEVAGTVDVVWGNAAAVLQNCTLRARRPLPGQKNTVTAQGRTDPNQSTGISLHRCRLVPAPELAAGRTYLGRPWKPYARVVYMMSYMAEHVAAGGWLAWDASARAPDSTVYYGEYQNCGPGAAVAGRLAWPGHRVIMLEAEAMEFTVGRFIGGDSWLPPTGVAFVAGLTA